MEAGTFKGLKKDVQRGTLRLPELLNMFEKECKRQKLRGLDRITSHVKALRTFFDDMPVADLDEVQIERFKNHRLDQGRTERTVNRGLQYLHQALKLAQKKKLITTIPLIEKFSEKGNARQGFFDHASFERVVTFLPEDLHDFVRFGYWSGWRKGEISNLCWEHIHDGAIRLPPELDKSKEGRVLKLVGTIAVIIDRRRALQRPDAPWVFYRILRGKVWPVMRFNKVWKRACSKAGVSEERLFHDLRRTAARNMDQTGVPQQVQMKALGHKTDSMWRRYRIADEQEVEEAQVQTERFLAKVTPQ
jgi:integrase